MRVVEWKTSTDTHPYSNKSRAIAHGRGWGTGLNLRTYHDRRVRY